MILRVGLTGGIACGKSTVARTFSALGCVTIDADEIVAKLYLRGGAGHTALVESYGAGILDEDGEIDRRKLADAAFSDTKSSKKLNALIHPLVRDEEERIVAAEQSRFPERDRIFITEATLMLEAGGKDRYDKIVVVDARPEIQLERGIARGLTKSEVERRMKYQMTREERLRHADYVIDNSGERRDLEIATHEVYEKLRKDLEEKKKRR